MARQPGQPPNAQQRRFNANLRGANTGGLRAARQIAQSRSFIYDGSGAPTCLSCGGPRQNKRLSKCDICAGVS